MNNEIRRLNDAGTSEYRKWIGQGAQGAAPLHLLTDEETSEPVGALVQSVSGSFTSKKELAKEVFEAFPSKLLESVWYDEGVWNGLALQLFDSICPEVNGSRKVQDMARYVFDERTTRIHRHLVRAPVFVFALRGDAALSLLHGSGVTPLSPDVHGDALEQLMGGGDILRSQARFEVAMSLYSDAAAGRLRRGMSSSKRPGNVRRLKKVMRQLDRNWDLDTAKVDEVLGLLPAEFASWLPRAA